MKASGLYLSGPLVVAARPINPVTFGGPDLEALPIASQMLCKIQY